MIRRLPVLLVLLLALVVAGCGNKQEIRTQGETEGLYLDLGELLYQVQISRQLNPDDVEDSAYLRGLPEGTEPPSPEETWFAVFLRVQNATDVPRQPADQFRVVNSDER